jgi:RNA polymerase sigma-70 factor (ECF subfamily)
MEDAEDVAVEVFEAIHRMGGRLIKKKDLRPYIFGIARRKVADKLRSRSQAQPDNETNQPDLAEQSLLKLQIGQALKQLPEQQREVLLLKYLHGFSTKEIASIVGKSSKAVNSLLQRARATFAEHASDLIS